jgi:hypothetical protein
MPKLFHISGVFKSTKNFAGAKLKKIPNGFGIPNPKMYFPDLRSIFGISKSRGIGIRIPLALIHVDDVSLIVKYIFYENLITHFQDLMRRISCGKVYSVLPCSVDSAVYFHSGPGRVSASANSFRYTIYWVK